MIESEFASSVNRVAIAIAVKFSKLSLALLNVRWGNLSRRHLDEVYCMTAASLGARNFRWFARRTWKLKAAILWQCKSKIIPIHRKVFGERSFPFLETYRILRTMRRGCFTPI